MASGLAVFYAGLLIIAITAVFAALLHAAFDSTFVFAFPFLTILDWLAIQEGLLKEREHWQVLVEAAFVQNELAFEFATGHEQKPFARFDFVLFV